MCFVKNSSGRFRLVQNLRRTKQNDKGHLQKERSMTTIPHSKGIFKARRTNHTNTHSGISDKKHVL